MRMFLTWLILIRKQTVGIVAAGFTGYELAALGCPAILFALTPIQLEVAEELQRRGVAIAISALVGSPLSGIRDALKNLLRNPKKRKAMTKSCIGMFDTLGVSRVVDAILRDSG